MRQNLHTEIALNAFNMAVERQRPAPGPIHHSDRGIQYAPEGLSGCAGPIRDHAIDEPKGRLLVQCPMESFLHTLKTERVHHRVFATRD